MATAVITLEDKEDGQVSVSCEFTPKIGKDKDISNAQATALVMIDAVSTPAERQNVKVSA